MCFRLSLAGGAECGFCEDQSREKRIRPQEMGLTLIFIKPGMPDGFKAEFCGRARWRGYDHCALPERMPVLTLRKNGNVPAPEDFNREKYPIGKNNARSSPMGNGRALCVIERKAGVQPYAPAA